MGKGKTFSKTKQTDETAPEKRKAKKKRGSCCPFFGSNSAEDTDEDNAPSHDSGAIELATVVSIGKDPDHKETASQISSKRDSTYDNISRSEDAEIHKAPTPESKEVKSENLSNEKKIEKKIYVKPKEASLGATHVPASTASAAQPLDEVNSASSTRRHREENNDEVKLEHENHQLPLTSPRFVQQSFSQESVPSQKTKNISDHKPSVDQIIDKNSGHQSPDADGIVNKRRTPEETGQNESMIAGENKKTVAGALKETGETWCTAEQLQGSTADNLVTRKVHNKHEEELPVSQTGCETYDNISTKIEEVSEKTEIGSLAKTAYAMQNYYVESIAEPKGNINKVVSKKEEWLFGNMTNSRKETVFDGASGCKTTYFGGTEMTSDKTVEDNQNNRKETVFDGASGCKTTYFGGTVTDTTSDKTVDDNQNNGKETLFHETSDCRTESDQEQHPLGHMTFNRDCSDKNMEEFVEDSRKGEHPTGLTVSSLETIRPTSEESGIPAYKLLRDSGRPAEDKPTEMDDPHGLEGNEDQQDHAYVEGHRNEAEGQDSASVLQNTEAEPANDQEETEDRSPTASVAKTPHEKLTDARRPVGLQNLGNTCFFNAAMQNINQSFLLYEVLLEEGCRLPLTKSMLEFYNRMCSGNSTVNPHEVLSGICQRSPRFAGGRQQDSHELLRHLLDGLRNEEREFLGNPNNRKILTKVDKVFGGHFMTVYTCKDCKTPYHVCEPLLDISLPIAYEDFQTDEESSVNEEDGEVSRADTAGDGVMYQKVAESLMTPLAIKQKKEAQDNRNDCVPEVEAQQPSKKQKKKNKRKNNDKSNVQHSTTEKRRRKERSILDCLDAFTRTEHIADEYLCMACHAERVNRGATDYQMTSAKKRTLIYNPPALLTLHLKRFEQTPYGFVKCNEKISFQDMIDIGPYCSSWCMRNEGNERSIWYSLYGLVEHSGSLDGGHYVAYIKLRERDDNIRQFLQESYLDRDQLTEEKLVEMMKQMHGLHKPNQSEKWQPKPVKGDWFYISDSHCSKVSEEEVWQQQAYLLFYERRQGSTKSKCYQRTAMTTSV